LGAFAFPESMKSHKLLQTGCFFKLIRVPKAALYIKSREALLSSFSSFFRKLPSYGSPNRIITSTLASKANFVVIKPKRYMLKDASSSFNMTCSLK
jgi:hypothetical protein